MAVKTIITEPNQLLREVIITGRKFTAQEAFNFHLINLVFRERDFNKNCTKLLHSLSNNNKEITEYYFKNVYS